MTFLCSSSAKRLPLPFCKGVCGDWTELSYLSCPWGFEQYREARTLMERQRQITFYSIINKFLVTGRIRRTRYTRVVYMFFWTRLRQRPRSLLLCKSCTSTLLPCSSLFFIHSITGNKGPDCNLLQLSSNCYQIFVVCAHVWYKHLFLDSEYLQFCLVLLRVFMEWDIVISYWTWSDESR